MDACLERTLREIQRATHAIKQEELAWHPDGKWSAAQVLEHLSLAYAGTTKGMQRAVAGENLARPRTLKDRISALVVIGLGYMPGGRQAPKGTVPGLGNPQHAVATILENLTAMDEAITRVEETKGRRIRLQHPILGPLTIPQWRKFHWVHTAHHMKQIDRLRAMQKNRGSELQASNRTA